MSRSIMPIVALCAVTGAACAQNGTVTITGQLLAPSCVVLANGGTTGNATVTLPPRLTSELGAAGLRSGRTNWTLQVGSAAQPCLHPNVKAEFVTGVNVNASGRLTNTGTATGVEVVVLNSSDQDINLRTNANAPSVAVPASGVATLTYKAEYYATAATRPGSVTTSVQYNITYP